MKYIVLLSVLFTTAFAQQKDLTPDQLQGGTVVSPQPVDHAPVQGIPAESPQSATGQIQFAPSHPYFRVIVKHYTAADVRPCVISTPIPNANNCAPPQFFTDDGTLIVYNYVNHFGNNQPPNANDFIIFGGTITLQDGTQTCFQISDVINPNNEALTISPVACP